MQSQLVLPHHSSLTLQGKKKKRKTLSLAAGTHLKLICSLSTPTAATFCKKAKIILPQHITSCFTGLFSKLPGVFLIRFQGFDLSHRDHYFYCFLIPLSSSTVLVPATSPEPTTGLLMEPCLKQPTIFILPSIRSPSYITTSCFKRIKNHSASDLSPVSVLVQRPAMVL